jgi:hypothetical protein
LSTCTLNPHFSISLWYPPRIRISEKRARALPLFRLPRRYRTALSPSLPLPLPPSRVVIKRFIRFSFDVARCPRLHHRPAKIAIAR